MTVAKSPDTCMRQKAPISLQWRHNDNDGVSNHQPHGCLLNRLFRRRWKKTSKLRVTGLCAGNSPHKWPVTRKMFPFDDVIMSQRLYELITESLWTFSLFQSRLLCSNQVHDLAPVTTAQLPWQVQNYELICVSFLKREQQEYRFSNESNKSFKLWIRSSCNLRGTGMHIRWTCMKSYPKNCPLQLYENDDQIKSHIKIWDEEISTGFQLLAHKPFGKWFSGFNESKWSPNGTSS